jgi:uncharacterized protein (DUF736 family)
MPTAYLAAIEGWARTHHGVNAFLYVDFAAPVFAALIYGAAVLRSSNPSDRALKLSVS